MRNVKALFLNFILLCGVSVILQTVALSFQAYLARNLGSEGLGLIQLTLSVYFLAATFAQLGEATARNNAVYMWVEAEVLTPGMEHSGVAGGGAKIFLVSRQLLYRLSYTAEKQIVTALLVPVNPWIQLLRYGEYHMKVAHMEQVSLLRVNPAFFGECLAFRTVPVTAGVVGWSLVSTLRTVIHVASKFGRAAIENGVHRFMLSHGQPVVLAVCFTVFLKDILYLRHLMTPSVCGPAF